MPRYMCVKKCFRKMPGSNISKLYYNHDTEEFKNDKEAGNHFVRLDSPKEIMQKRRLEVISSIENELTELEKVQNPDAPTKRKISELKGRIDMLAGTKKGSSKNKGSDEKKNSNSKVKSGPKETEKDNK